MYARRRVTSKLILWMSLAFVLLIVSTTMASANGGPHGGCTATTDACAGRHRAHTASAPNL